MFKIKNKKIIVFSGIFLALIISVLWYSFSYSSGEYGDYESAIIVPAGSDTPYIDRPGWMAISPNNENIYLSDSGSRHVLIFNSNEEYLGRISSLGTGEGQFASPQGLAIGTDNELNDVVYIVDDNLNKILKFNYLGEFILEWGSSGLNNGEFDGPQDIALDTEGNVYVVDTGNNRVQKFDSDGVYITQWGQSGSGNSQFDFPNGVAIDSDNNIYITDTHNNRVQKFNNSGEYLTQWGNWGTGAINFWDPMGIFVDIENNVYVVDQGNNNKIRKFNSNGVFLEIVISSVLAENPDDDGTISRAIDIEMNSEGDIYVSDEYNRIQKFSLGVKTDYYQNLKIFYQNNGDFNIPSYAAIDSSDNIYVVDTGNNRVQKFDSSGTYVSQFGSPGNGDGQFLGPQGIAIDLFDNIYVADTNNNRIQKFDSSGTYVSQFGSFGSGNGQFENPVGIVIDSSNSIYVVDSSNNRVQKFDSSGTYVFQFGSDGAGNGEFDLPYGIALDSLKNIYVTDYGNDRIQKFDSHGTYVSQFGSSGGGDGEFKNPTDIFLDSHDYIYVVDHGNNRIQKFDSSGTYVSQFGSVGIGDGEFKNPVGIALNSLDYIYVVDYGNYRVQKFDKTFVYNTKWGSAFSSGIYSNSNLSINPVDNHVFVSDRNKNLVSEFDSSGDFIGFVETNTELSVPTGSVFDSLGNIYIFDRADCLIKKYDFSSPQRQFIVSWGGCGSASSTFNLDNFEAAIDSSNNIYVVDTQNDRIQKFDSSGNYITEWLISSPIDVVVDGHDNIYVASNGPHRITKFLSDGTYITHWEKDIEDVSFQNIYSLAIDSFDDIYVSDNNGFIEYIKKFDYSGQPINNIDINYYPYNINIDLSNKMYVFSNEYGGNIGQFIYGDYSAYVFNSKIVGENEFVFGSPFAVSLGNLNVTGLESLEFLVVPDYSEHDVKIFVVSGETINYMATLGEYGTSTLGDFNMPSKTILKDKYIYMADAGNHRIQRFDASTNTMISWGSFGDGPGQFGGESLIGGGYLLGMTADSDGNIYVADTFNGRVQKFDPDGVYITEWEASYPFGIAIDHDSNIFTSCPFLNIIQKFDADGNLIKEFGETGSENGQFNLAAGLHIDFNNYLYVADGGNDRIQKFDKEGEFLDKWGESGSELGQFDNPLDVATDNDGNIYVADSDNKRIQVLYISPKDPYALVVSSHTINSITLSWEGNTYSYYIENITNSDASGWIQNNSYTFTNLTCGENYSFRVKAKNYSGEETGWSDSLDYSISCPEPEPEPGSNPDNSLIGYSSELPLPICDDVEYNDWETCKEGFNNQFRTIKKTDPVNCYLSVEQRQAMERSCSLGDYEEDQKIVDNDEVENIDQGYLLNIRNITSREKSLVSLVNSRLVNKLKGFILLQAENYGELWYLNPVDNLKYYMGNPLATFNIISIFGLGVSNNDFVLFEENGVPDRLAGRILLRVEDNGEAYYVNPVTMELHYLSRPHEAFETFKELALGISNINIRKIEVGWQ